MTQMAPPNATVLGGPHLDLFGLLDRCKWDCAESVGTNILPDCVDVRLDTNSMTTDTAENCRLPKLPADHKARTTPMIWIELTHLSELIAGCSLSWQHWPGDCAADPSPRTELWIG